MHKYIEQLVTLGGIILSLILAHPHASILPPIGKESSLLHMWMDILSLLPIIIDIWSSDI